jgi:hypothetical protein
VSKPSAKETAVKHVASEQVGGLRFSTRAEGGAERFETLR